MAFRAAVDLGTRVLAWAKLRAERMRAVRNMVAVWEMGEEILVGKMEAASTLRCI